MWFKAGLCVSVFHAVTARTVSATRLSIATAHGLFGGAVRVWTVIDIQHSDRLPRFIPGVPYNRSMSKVPDDIQAEHRIRDELKAAHNGRGVAYAFAVLVKAPGVAFVNLLLVVLWFAAWPVTLTLLDPLQDMGPLLLIAVIVLGFVQFLVANWLAASIWRGIGETARNLIRSPMVTLGVRTKHAILLLGGVAIVSALLGALGVEPEQSQQRAQPQTASAPPTVVRTRGLLERGTRWRAGHVVLAGWRGVEPGLGRGIARCGTEAGCDLCADCGARGS